MGPIVPLGPNNSIGAAYVSLAREAAAVATARPSAGSAAGLTQLDSAIGQMLTGIGGTLEADRTLQVLIGLIILLALLRAWQGDNESPQSALSSLDRGRHEVPWIGLFGSQTVVQLQQNTTTIVLAADGAYVSMAEGASASSGTGGFELTV